MKSKYNKKIKNGKEYYFFRLRHENLEKPKDIYGRTIKELETKIKNEKILLDANIIKTEKTYKEIIEEWLYEVKFQTIKNTSKELYDKVYRNHIKNNNIMKIKINKLKKNDIQKFYNELAVKGTGIAIIKIIKIEIEGSIKYAYNNEYIIKDFSKMAIAPKESEEEKLKKRNKIKVLTEQEEKTFIEKIKGERLEMLYLLALSSGARQSELLALTWNDIDFKNNKIKISKIAKCQQEIAKGKRGKCKVVIQTPKTKSSNRTITIPENMTKKLKEYKKIQDKKIGNINKHNLLFCNPLGEYISGNSVYAEFKKAIKRINKDKEEIPEITFHGLRHTYATRLFEKGISPKVIQETLGHSNISITLNVYTHISDYLKEEIGDKINYLFE